MKEKVILAYSGGLDTSVILKWLIDKGYDVVAYIADLGQNEDLQAAKAKALQVGAIKAYIEDLKEELVTDYLFPALKADALYEGRYMLGTSIARPLIAKRHIDIARKEKCRIVAHGATGKGNDQVRFEMAYLTLMPEVKIISPWKDPEFTKMFKGRSDMIAYAEKNKIPISQTAKKPYSTDANIIHVSYEAGELEDPARAPSDDMYKFSKTPMAAPDKKTDYTLEFKKGLPTKVTCLNDKTVKTGSYNIFTYLNKIGAENGIGTIDIVENRFVGMKSRGVYETPGATILWKTHKDIESLTLDREVFTIKEEWVPVIGKLIYYGFWFAPEMELYMAAINKSQEHVEGKVFFSLYKGNVIINGRSSPNSLYNQNVASMDELGNYDQSDAKGFIKLNALRLRIYNQVHKEW